jgi:hypothetical protein
VNTAIVDGVEVEAGVEAPQKGRCPACGGRVALWNHPRGGCYYRHVAGEGKGCPRRVRPVRREQIRNPPRLVQDDPELTLAVRITSTVAIDALNGDEEALLWLLEHPLPRMTLEALDIDPDVALARMTAQVQAEPSSGSAASANRLSAHTPGRLVGTAMGG